MSTLQNNISKTVKSDLVGTWSVPLLDGIHTVEFEHGTTSGKRVLRIDGEEIYRKEWMFKLVGDEEFYLGSQKARCELRVDPLPNFTFGYTLLVDGKPLEKFIEKQNQATRSWIVISNGKKYRIVFEKQTLNVWVNGEPVETESDFTEGGAEMIFSLDSDVQATVRAAGTDKRQGVVHELLIGGSLIQEDIFRPDCH